MQTPSRDERDTRRAMGADAVETTTPTPASSYALMSRDELLETLSERDHQVAELQSALAIVQQEKHGLASLVQDLLNSWSWRLTTPLRKAIQVKRDWLPLCRFRSLTLGIGQRHNIDNVSEGVYAIKGPTPFLELVPASPQSKGGGAEAMPAGWVQVTADLQAQRGEHLCALYYRTGDSFTPGDKTWISIGPEKKEPALIKLPFGVKGLRLDPFDIEGEFQLTQVCFRELGSLNLAWQVSKGHLRTIVTRPQTIPLYVKRLRHLFRRGLLPTIKQKLIAAGNFHDYPTWVRSYDEFAPEDFSAMSRAATSLKISPTVSVLMPTYNTPEKFLRRAIESVLAQVYPHWELCIADDASSLPHVRKILEEYATKDARIKVTFRQENGHISEASNSALELATGDYVALLDHDDELTPDALLIVVKEIEDNPTVKFLYSDEDKKTSEGQRFNPYFKSDWNPELLLSQNYVCHLAVFKREVLHEVGGFRKGVEGAQDWDLVLRVVDAIAETEIRHIPHILYHWRVIEGSTAKSTSYKPYVLQAQKRAVGEHLERLGEKAALSVQHDISQLRVKFAIPEPHPRVSLIIPTRDMVHLLAQCVDSILRKTKYREFDIVIVDNGSSEQQTFRYFERIKSLSNVRVIRDDAPFNFSRLNNLAVRETTTPLIGLINNDLEVISPEWLEEMVSYAVRPGVGAVGARLYFPGGLLQHGGVVLGIGGVAGHSHKGRPRHDGGYFNRVILPSCFSAVTAACLILRREVYNEVGGLDEENFQVAFNDVDFCLRIRERGYRIVYNPYAELYHHESASRGYETTSPEKFQRFEGEVERMKKRWGNLLRNDPYYNPNLTLLSEDFAFSFPPRQERFWRRLRDEEVLEG